MKQTGVTLFELLIVLLITGITLALGIPSFSEHIKRSQTKIAAQELLSAIESARSLAVYTNKRTVLIAKEQNWQKGWQLFIDDNDDGELNESETIQFETSSANNVRIQGNSHVRRYISFIGSGEGRKTGIANGGAFQVGTIKICPKARGEGYALILSRGGRTRTKALSKSECDNF